MGIYDREYYRRSGPSFLASFSERGRACKWLIGINIGFFLIQVLTRQPDARFPDSEGPFTNALWLNADSVLRGEIWRLLTYAFLHDTAAPLHIVFNMLFLWWFGTDMEDRYGLREFLAIYLVAAILGGLAFVCQMIWMPADPLSRFQPCLGASGAVTAVLVLCAIHDPARIIYISFLLPVPIWLFVVFQVAQDLFGLLSGHAGRTAVSVHLAGAAFALLYYKSHVRLLNLWPGLPDVRRRPRNRARLRIYREDSALPEAASTSTGENLDEQLEAKLDAVLEKVARFGQGSLSDSERQILLRASDVYKKRRT
jgi:membrane associated rhomboid family serine protease